jgi:hypothetical protein
VEEHFAKTVSMQTLFPPEEDRFYYFVREGYATQTSSEGNGYKRHKEGFAHHMQYLSELIEGRVYIDGYYRRDIGLGDSFIVDSKPEYRLKCIRFLI